MTNVRVHYSRYGISIWANASLSVEVTDIGFSSIDLNDVFVDGTFATMTIINPKVVLGTVRINADSDALYEKFTCDINVCDKDGVAISGAVVDCLDKNSNAVWTAGSVTTNGSGNITQQQILYRDWELAGNPATAIIYSPHKFTISKAGYQTLVLENTTVDHPIVWHLELQDEVAETRVLGQRFIYPEPEYIPVPIPMGAEIVEKSPNEMNQKEYELWRRKGGGR